MYTDKDNNVWYKIQLHMHTTISDGSLSPEDAAERYKNAGFDAIALTDHWKYHAEDNISGIKVFSGCEYNLGASDTSTDVMHIVGIGMNYEPEVDKSTCSRQDVIDKICQAGGLAVLAHPAWSLNTPQHAKELNGFGAVEIYNTVSNAGESSRPYSGYFVDLLANEGIFYPLIAADDTHYYNGTDDTKSYIMVKATELSKNAVLVAIRNGDFYATQGPELYVKKENDTIIVDCSECVMINFLSNLAWARNRMIKSEKLLHAEYKLHPSDKWVRVEIMDKQGNYAWSNVIMIK